MDVETADAIDNLGGRIDASERSLLSAFESVRDDVGRLAERVEDSRRHADILNESVRDDIRMVAEGVAALGAKLDARP